jgi:hypothetical protein
MGAGVNLRTLLILVALAVVTYAEDPGNHFPFAAGKIERLDAGLRQLIIHTPTGSQTFAVTERTYVYRGKEKLSFEKLRIGDAIKLNYYTNETGHAFIRRIKVDQPPPPEEPPAP